MKKRLVSVVLLLGLLACSGTVLARDAGYVTAVVDGKSADRIHLRERPNANAKSLGLYFTGTAVLCEPYAGNEWVWVNVGTQAGYMKAEFLYRGNNPGSVKPRQPAGVVKSQNAVSWVNMRLDPSLDASVVARLYPGDAVTVLGETVTKWYYVRAGELYGYIRSDFLLVGDSVSPGPKSAAPSGVAALSAYKAVMQNNAPFIHAENNQPMFLYQLADLVTDVTMQIARFAAVDLDQDGTPEIILNQAVQGSQYDYGSVVLHYQDGVVYGHAFVLRALKDLKADGTFSFSSGAFDNGFGTMRFAKNTASVDETAYCHSGYDARNNSTVSYFVNHRPSSAQAFDAALDKQRKKPNATWYDFTYANIEAMRFVTK